MNDQELVNNPVYVNGLDQPLLALADHIAGHSAHQQALRVAVLKLKQQPQQELEAFKLGMRYAAQQLYSESTDLVYGEAANSVTRQKNIRVAELKKGVLLLSASLTLDDLQRLKGNL